MKVQLKPILLAVLPLFCACAQAQQPSPAFSSEDFLNSIGINGSPIQTRIYEDGPFKGAGTTFDPQIYHDLGIRHYRKVLKFDLTLENQPQQVLDVWRKTGARAMLFLDHNKTKPEEVLPLLAPYDPRAVVELEGPNEPNNKFPPQDLNHKYKGRTDEAATALYMQEVYDAIKADPKWKDLPVVAYSAIFTDYGLAKGHTGFDFGNMHSYQGYGVPSSSLLMNITRFNNIYPEGATIKPIVPTEVGYNVEADVSNGTFKVGSYRAQALNIPMLLAEYFRHGIPRTYLFAIHNADGYGLLESDLKTKRPSYFALKNFLDEVRETKWNPANLRWEGAKPFTPRSLNFTLENAPETVHSLTLQKSNGDYRLLLWNEVQNFDQNQNKDLFPAPVKARIKFNAPIGAQVVQLIQNDKGAYDTKNLAVKNGVLELEIPSSVSILRIKGGALPRIAAPIAVTNLSGKATHHQADLTWNPTPNAAGYFVFRNGWHIATTTQPSFSERSTWLRPGLGYTYEVQAFDKWGQTAPRTKTVVFTPNGRPDLVVTRVWSEGSEVGKPANLRATIKNIGDGPTPLDVTSAVTFFVDGKYISFGGVTQILNPGEERTVAPDGGNTNWAPEKTGSYLVTAEADDVNRVGGERSETNNKTAWTLRVGQTPGLLEIATETAPYSVNLETEGTRDWVAFGTQDGEKSAALAATQRKTGANLVGDLTAFGNGHLASTVGGAFRLSRMGTENNASLWWNGVGHGVAFSVPASQTEQTLKLYVSGLNGARGKLEVSLSDQSAPSVTSTTLDGNRGNGNWAPIPDNFSGVYLVKFRSPNADAKLNVRWSMDNEPNQWNGQLRLSAATLR